MEGTWAPPVTDGSGRDRAGLRRAFALFAAAGYQLKGTQLVHAASGRPFAFEILTTTRDQERLALAFVRNLKRAGIDARVRSVDATQFERRRISFDFDMMQYRWEQSLSPGNEQSCSTGARRRPTQEGSRNYMGVKSKAVDAMIAAMLERHQPRGFRRRHPRARPRAAVRLLRGAALFPAQTMDSALDPNQASLADFLVRLSAGNLVARGRQMILSGSATRADGNRATLDDLFRRAGVRHAGRAGADRSAQWRELHRPRAATADLCAGRPRDIGARRQAARARACRPTPWWRCSSPTPWTASSRCSACCAPA